MKQILSVAITVVLLMSITLGQTAFMQLTPGASTRSDGDRVLGQPVNKLSETLSEYRSKETGQKLYIQYGQQSGVIDRVEVMFDNPVDRAAMSGLLGIGQKSDTTKWDAKGRLEEYFGSTKLLVLTHETSEMSSPVIRVGYYSRELFAVALEKPTGTPQRLTPQLTSAPTGSVKGSNSRTTTKVFDKVDMLVQKGDKTEEKSVRLIFDGNAVVIESDKGETVYKSFPYASIKSAEYSYSKQPRWKTAIGAAILIGVFALPLFFMKGKKHWLTIKTADDFAILHLDKNNYKVILPTFETSTGKNVDTVAEEK